MSFLAPVLWISIPHSKYGDSVGTGREREQQRKGIVVVEGRRSAERFERCDDDADVLEFVRHTKKRGTRTDTAT
jgi:hypothetical protein